MSNPKEQFTGRSPGLAMEERRRRIRTLIEENAQGTVAELADRFGVSAVTIRTNLAALEHMGAVVRTHGGALPRRDSDELPINVKQTLHRAQKVASRREPSSSFAMAKR
jgi:DeoR family transcriptional regulator, aga operon transcriptional repressor